ncbi:MAG: RecQ family ATP-dependent DNA helicase [Acidimicrobiia bacterium]|nr:RecQ family ATP-dependent DNA helicase [Acidimicrobiia bacterium]
MTADVSTAALSTLRALVNSPVADFRAGQLDAITALVEERRRVLVVQRTGWGKSAVYFVATRLLRDRGAGPTVIVSPLLALMRNQVDAGERGGVVSVSINSNNRDEWDDISARLDRDEIDVLLISPERFANSTFRESILPTLAPRVGMLVVDEVHCISDWGHDFRPDYRRIAEVLNLLPPGVPVLGTTATANDRVVADIETQFGDAMLTIRGSLARPSLILDTLRMPSQPDRLAWLAQVIPTLPGTGIVYCLTIADCQRVAGWLTREGIDAAAYSGDSDPELRRVLEDRLLANELKVLVATSALGMGYDKPDLAFVIHFQSPGSPIAYYQQVGRAGRALTEAHGVLMSGHEDRDIQDYFIRTAFPPADRANAIVDLLADRGDWTRIGDIEAEVNIRRGRLTSMLKILEVEGVVTRDGTKYRRTALDWTYPTERIDTITEQRRAEQRVMDDYLASDTCLMELLGRALDDPTASACGRCSRCTGTSLPVELDQDRVVRAREYLRSQPLTIDPRKMRAAGGRIPADLQLESGRALAFLGDGGWGGIVRDQRADGAFSDELVDALVRLVRNWEPNPRPKWVTAVPSRRAPTLVASLAERVAEGLRLPYRATLDQIRDTEPQARMENSAQQHRNVLDAFAVVGPVPTGAVLLVDDIVDSRWTLTEAGAMLRGAGAEAVIPLALAQGASD